MRQVKSEEARRNFRDLLDEAERGGFIEVLRYDRPVAVLVPAGWYEEASAAIRQLEPRPWGTSRADGEGGQS